MPDGSCEAPSVKERSAGLLSASEDRARASRAPRRSASGVMVSLREDLERLPVQAEGVQKELLRGRRQRGPVHEVVHDLDPGQYGFRAGRQGGGRDRRRHEVDPVVDQALIGIAVALARRHVDVEHLSELVKDLGKRSVLEKDLVVVRDQMVDRVVDVHVDHPAERGAGVAAFRSHVQQAGKRSGARRGHRVDVDALLVERAERSCAQVEGGGAAADDHAEAHDVTSRPLWPWARGRRLVAGRFAPLLNTLVSILSGAMNSA